LAKHCDFSGSSLVQVDDCAQQYGFACARTADHAKHFALADFQVEVVMDNDRAKLRPQPLHMDR
jgi:hypothetical protein